MKRIILCADDYGQNTSISQAIIELLEKKSLSATSCMTNVPDWLIHAKWLVPYQKTADIGLHFNLTEGKALSSGVTFDSLGRVIAKAFLNQLNHKAIEAELESQLDQFVEGLGQAPDFIDGHQHIHQLPGIREILLRVYRKRFPARQCYIRSVYTPWMKALTPPALLKKTIIQLCGAAALQKILQQENIPHNFSFSGIYSFSAQEYPAIFPEFLKESVNQGIIMCHPGLPGSVKSLDPIAAAREAEFRYFSSDVFRQTCEAEAVQIGRFAL